MRACKRIQRNIRSFLQCKRARVLCVLRVWEDMELHLVKVHLISSSLAFASFLLCPFHSSDLFPFAAHIVRAILFYLPLLPHLSTPPPLTLSSILHAHIVFLLTTSLILNSSSPFPIHPSLPLSPCHSQRMLRKVAKEKVQRKSLDGSITQSMMAWQQRRSVQDNNEAMRAFTKAKGDTDLLSLFH
jgi:hypothetical protein